MNQCEIVKDLLPIYIDELCSETSSIYVKEHLEQCEDCRFVHQQMMTELSEEHLEVNKLSMQQKRPFEKMKKVFNSYRYISKLLEWMTVIGVVFVLLLFGKAFFDMKQVTSDFKHQQFIENEQKEIMENAFNSVAKGGQAGLEELSEKYQYKINYIALFDATEVEPLSPVNSFPKAIYPIPYEKAVATYRNGQLNTEQIIPMDYDIATMAMERDDYIIQFEYTPEYIQSVERAFQTKHYAPSYIEIFTPAFVALIITMCMFILWKTIKRTNRNAQSLIE
ncbi:zf-HC2 domain-containing protein [Solibacillus sp. FSL R7-0682]|uniref:zf-HC2 domain-containing protein n=1 Tax=Solibacillus sp. FSL R7-0682 TaxID=2921690 RepID=UPI0030F99FA0